MIIQKGSDLVIDLVATADLVRIFTTDETNYIEKKDVADTQLHIEADELTRLSSGVIAYSYYHCVDDEKFSDKKYNKIDTIYTDYYYRDTSEHGDLNTDVSKTVMDYIKESLVPIKEQLKDAGKVDDIRINGDSLVTNKIANLDILKPKIVESSDSEISIEPNKEYTVNIGESLVINIVPPTDETITNYYRCNLDTSDVVPSVTIKINGAICDQPELEANSHTELVIHYHKGVYYHSLETTIENLIGQI